MSYINNIDGFLKQNRSFFEYLKEMEESLEHIPMKKIVEEAGGPENVAVISVDVIEGFCRIGPLASPRVKAIIEPIVEILRKAYDLGVRNFVLPQDTHPEDSPEFAHFPPHCVEETEEAETVREFKELPFFNLMKVIQKRSINSGIDTDLEEWLLEKNPKKIIVLGDCTDLCTYHLALHVKLFGNAKGYHWEVIVPDNAIATYDLPVDIAKKIGATPHPGDLLHIIFLYHMKLNGINAVREIV
ncbi:MAG: cysteine hydrolase [Candidatus Eremiobacteraeota bacterium]|nr:cysteine hydrolase [Candidatus Eremiobacteraeota bacterium]